jgi:hypothetical protein
LSREFLPLFLPVGKHFTNFAPRFLPVGKLGLQASDICLMSAVSPRRRGVKMYEIQRGGPPPLSPWGCGNYASSIVRSLRLCRSGRKCRCGFTPAHTRSGGFTPPNGGVKPPLHQGARHKVAGQASHADPDGKLVAWASRPLGRGHPARALLGGSGTLRRTGGMK